MADAVWLLHSEREFLAHALRVAQQKFLNEATALQHAGHPNLYQQKLWDAEESGRLAGKMEDSLK